MQTLQRRALRIIYPVLSYSEALEAVGIDSLHKRRQALIKTLFDKIVKDTSHNLQPLLPPINEASYCIRNQSFLGYAFTSLLRSRSGRSHARGALRDSGPSGCEGDYACA